MIASLIANNPALQAQLSTQSTNYEPWAVVNPKDSQIHQLTMEKGFLTYQFAEQKEKYETAIAELSEQLEVVGRLYSQNETVIREMRSVPKERGALKNLENIQIYCASIIRGNSVRKMLLINSVQQAKTEMKEALRLDGIDQNAAYIGQTLAKVVDFMASLFSSLFGIERFPVTDDLAANIAMVSKAEAKAYAKAEAKAYAKAYAEHVSDDLAVTTQMFDMFAAADLEAADAEAKKKLDQLASL